MATRYEHAGGEAAIHGLEEVCYSGVLADPLLQPLFGAGRPHHVDHLTAFTSPTPRPTTRCTRCARCPAGPGPATAER